MNKFHISEDGQLRPCKAVKRECSLGEHYDSIESYEKSQETFTTLKKPEKSTESKDLENNLNPVEPKMKIMLEKFNGEIPKPKESTWLGLIDGSPGQKSSYINLYSDEGGYARYNGEKLFHGSSSKFEPGDIIESVPESKEGWHSVAYASVEKKVASAFMGKNKDEGYLYEVEPIDPEETIHSKMKYPGFNVHLETLTKSGYRVIKVLKTPKN